MQLVDSVDLVQVLTVQLTLHPVIRLALLEFFARHLMVALAHIPERKHAVSNRVSPHKELALVDLCQFTVPLRNVLCLLHLL